MRRIFSKLNWIVKGRDGTSATIQTVLARVLIIGVNVLTGIVTARALGPEGRGEQAVMIVGPVLLASLVSLGIPSSLIYNIRKYPEDTAKLLPTALVLGVVSGGIVSLVGREIVPYWLEQYPPQVIAASQLLILCTPLSNAYEICVAALEARQDFSLANRIRFLNPMIVCVLLFSLLGLGYLSSFTAAMSYILNSVPLTLWMLWYLQGQIRLKVRGAKSQVRRVLGYGIKSYGVDALRALSQQTENVFGAGLLPPAQMGIYAIALSLARMLNIFQSSFVVILFPKIAARSQESALFWVGRVARLCLLTTAICSIPVFLFSPLAIGLMYGSDYAGANNVLRLLLLEVTISGGVTILAQAFMALGKPGIVTILQVIGLGLTVVLMVLLVPRFGVLGAGAAMLIGTTVRLGFVLACFPLVFRVQPPGLLIKSEDVDYVKSKVLASV